MKTLKLDDDSVNQESSGHGQDDFSVRSTLLPGEAGSRGDNLRQRKDTRTRSNMASPKPGQINMSRPRPVDATHAANKDTTKKLQMLTGTFLPAPFTAFHKIVTIKKKEKKKSLCFIYLVHPTLASGISICIYDDQKKKKKKVYGSFCISIYDDKNMCLWFFLHLASYDMMFDVLLGVDDKNAVWLHWNIVVFSVQF